MRNVVAYDLHARMHYSGRPLRDAAAELLTEVLPKDSGGLVAIDAKSREV